MSWLDEAIPVLRVIINDLGDTPTYSDGRLEQLLVVAAKLVHQDFKFDTYTISVSSSTITPDPVDDDAFLNFVVMRSACIVDEGMLRTKAHTAGIIARCGPAMLDTAGQLSGFKELILFGPCKAYAELKHQWLFSGNMTNIFRAIYGPFTSNTFSSGGVGFSLYREGYYS